jgi:hypothetical protein
VSAAATPAEQAREEARRILSERRYRGSDVPRPLHDALDWLGRRFHFVGRFYDRLSGVLGGHRVVWLIVAALVVALAAWAAARLVSRRASREAMPPAFEGVERPLEPRELERLAEEAEARGDLEIALRLRFRAGLLRLGRTHALEMRPSLTTREARRALRNPRFDALARDFDEVVYGRRPPSRDDLATARIEWPRVLAETRA